MTSILTCSPRLGCFRYLDEVAGVDIIDVTVNGNVLCDEWMLTDTPHVVDDASGLILDGVPFYELASARSITLLWIGPSFPVEMSGFQTINKQIDMHLSFR